jgi:hypothetical protein
MKSVETAAPALSLQVEDRRFLEIFNRLKAYGGMLSAEELQCLHRAGQTEFSLGQALLRREVMALKWRHRLWLPLFQFRSPTWEPLPLLSDVLTELVPVFQGFELIEWFLTPSPWLCDQRPIQALEVMPKLVHQVAQADRFLVTFEQPS